MAAAHSGQSPISFAEVALHFSSEEWALLSPYQRQLYEEVMMDNHDNVIFVASIWDQSGIKKEQAQSSQRRAHTGQKSLKFQGFGTTMNRSYSLKYHQTTHTSKKPCKCQECGMTFSQNSILISHQRTHTGEKPYKCQECGTTFNWSNALKRHQRTHTGEKPYKCQECGLTFNRSNALKHHQRTHTGETL